MKSYQFIPHTADIRLQVKADSLPNLFMAALDGMNEILKKGFCRKTKSFPLNYQISISAPDLSILLVDYLSEVLTKSYGEKALFCKVDFLKFGNNFLQAKIFGTKIGATEGFNEDIKAVTYHEAEVKKSPKGKWQTTLVFDI